MKLLRLAAAFIEPAPQLGSVPFQPIGARSPLIQVAILHAGRGSQGPLRLLMGAKSTLVDPLETTGDALLVIPPELRERMEAAIEHNVNFIAVRLGAKRRVASPSPCVALFPESAEDEQMLGTAAGIAGGSHGFVSAHARDLLPSDVVNRFDVTDRLDGVALLAEAISAGTALGEFHELVRVFERAFRLAGEALALPLAEFLQGAAGLGYTAGEVWHFLKEIREPATHADHRDEYFLEPQIRPVIARMWQAAYDVLLNKTLWRDPSVDRREAWTPNAGLASPDVPFIRRGHDAELQAIAMDPFGAYPYDMSAAQSEVPAGWRSWPATDALIAGPLELR